MLGQRGLRWQTCGGSSSSVGQKRGVVTTTRAFKRGQNKQRPGFTNAPMPNYPLPPIDPSQTAPQSPPPPPQQQPMSAPNNGGGAAFAPPPPQQQQQQQQQAGYPGAASPAQTQTLPRPGGGGSGPAGPQQISVAAPNTQQQQQQPGWSTTMPPPPAPGQQGQQPGQQQQINPQMPPPQQQGFTNQQPGFQGSTNPNPNNTWQQQTAPFNPQQQQQGGGGQGAFQTQPPPQQQQNNGGGYVNAGGWQQGQNNNGGGGRGGGGQSWQQQGGFLPDAGSYLDTDKGGYMDGGGYMDQQGNNNGGGFGAGAYINTPAQRGGWSQQGGSGYYKNNRQQQQQQQMDLSETGGYLNDPSWQPQQRNNRPGFTGFQNDGPGAWRDDYLLSQLDKKMPNNANNNNNYPIDGWEEEYVVEEDLTPKFVNGKRVMVNSEIEASQVRVQDASKGDLGIMAFDTARETAVAQDVDVVMITPDADPPVVRLIAFSKYKYEMEKSAKQKQKASKGPEIKEVKLRPVTEKADYDTKVKQAQKFLSKGAKVKLTMTFSGREMRFKDQGKEMMLQLIEELSSTSKMEAPLALRPSNFSVTLVPLK